ncbi:unnamed protein product [Caenorhabditis bovis]|uniref:Uncharacterized protein n=1 Tax=Caenorhabditis bovis TaxID=2654633 RepID=A0A8S1E8J7_9PELO|nr:unnamed protein product [Caenorhabditis bovis]
MLNKNFHEKWRKDIEELGKKTGELEIAPPTDAKKKENFDIQMAKVNEAVKKANEMAASLEMIQTKHLAAIKAILTEVEVRC